MTHPPHATTAPTTRPVAPEIAAEIAHEQEHVDQVYAELVKAGDRARLVEAEGMGRGFSDRGGAIREDEITGLFQRDALVHHASRRRQSLETQYEGLVFGRLDLTDEVRYIGRLGVRDDQYDPLVVDWRAPAASPFYRATPVQPQGVVRRRVLRCRDALVLGVEDDLMVPEAPDGMVVVGDGALMAALTRSRGTRMRDIVATIQQHQDEAIRAEARGVTEITGGPGTGKTVVALHRAAYLLYSNRRRFESGGILVVGPSSAYTAYIERVLPSLGEDSVSLRSLGDVVDGVGATRVDDPEAARVKGGLDMRQVLARAARDVPDDAPRQLRIMVGGAPVRIDSGQLQQLRRQVLRRHQHNAGRKAALDALTDAAWAQVRDGERPDFVERFHDHLEVEPFLDRWWAPRDPREVLLWLADAVRAGRYAHGILEPADIEVLRASVAETQRTGSWSVADTALIDDLSTRLGIVPEPPAEERGFYEVEELEDVSQHGVADLGSGGGRTARSERIGGTPRERLLAGRIGRAEEYAHVLVDEAQDLSPMQWRMVGRRGRYASWTVVGDAAQSSWSGQDEAEAAREEAFGSKERRRFHMDTNYRNAREIFAYAADVVRAQVPDADIPEAVRETGVDPRIVQAHVSSPANLTDLAQSEVADLLAAVEGSVAVVTPARYAGALARLGDGDARVVLVDPLSTKGLEYDATLIVDPDEITRESPGGVRVLYVALTRAAHRMTVLEVRS